MEEDVNTEVEDSASEEDSSTEEKTVPYSRFKEINEQKKTAEQERDSLKQKEGVLTPEQQKEKQAKDYLRGLIKEEREAILKAEKDAETQEQKKFEEEVSDILDVNPEVDKEKFLKFIEKDSNEYGISSVKGAMKLYKDMGRVKTDTEEATKEKLSKKPNLPKSEGTPIGTPPDDSNKTLDQIAEEAALESQKGQK